VHNLKSAGVGPGETVAHLEQQFGTPVNPADVASGQGRWNVGTSMVGGLRWTPDEKALFANLYALGKSMRTSRRGSST
jgi:hypothetical protein